LFTSNIGDESFKQSVFFLALPLDFTTLGWSNSMDMYLQKQTRKGSVGYVVVIVSEK